jgi:hypothetical protein
MRCEVRQKAAALFLKRAKAKAKKTTRKKPNTTQRANAKNDIGFCCGFQLE